MKIYILADMEGISGINRLEQVNRRDEACAEAYAEGCSLLARDINAAVAAAFDAGATDVVVCDTHGGGPNISADAIDSRAVYENPARPLVMPSLNETFAGVVLLGHHAMAGTLNGFLDHTMNSRKWFEFRINDRVVGEMGIEAAYASHYGVPVIAVSGDEATAAEARDLFGEIECAVVKRGVGRNSAECLPLDEAHQQIRCAVTRAMADPSRFTPYTPQLPATLELTFYRSDMADQCVANKPDVERVNARTVRTQIDSLKEIRTL